MERNDRNGRDAAGIGPYSRDRENLVPMSTLESWTVSSGEPDIRGWDVRTVSGRQLGSVRDLMVDKDAGEVVLLDVDLPGADRHTFVPIRVVEIDRAKRLVLMDSADLPDSAVASETRRDVVVDDSAPGVVRYPVTDREVRAAPPEIADSAPPTDSEAIARDRRRAERRRIDRVNTDF